MGTLLRGGVEVPWLGGGVGVPWLGVGVPWLGGGVGTLCRGGVGVPC